MLFENITSNDSRNFKTNRFINKKFLEVKSKIGSNKCTIYRKKWIQSTNIFLCSKHLQRVEVESFLERLKDNMATKLEISELDFDGIKANLKNFLSQQDEFRDYDFEGSGMAVLLDIL